MNEYNHPQHHSNYYHHWYRNQNLLEDHHRHQQQRHHHHLNVPESVVITFHVLIQTEWYTILPKNMGTFPLPKAFPNIIISRMMPRYSRKFKKIIARSFSFMEPMQLTFHHCTALFILAKMLGQCTPRFKIIRLTITTTDVGTHSD